MKLVCIIPTFNRNDKLLTLLKDIKRDSKEYDITVFIVNDGSTNNYDEVENWLQKDFDNKFLYTKTFYNHGKVLFWKNINYMYSKCKKIDFDYVFGFNDDFRLADNYFTKAINLFEAISDSNKVCLNTMRLKENDNNHGWNNGHKLIDLGDVFLSQWVETTYIANKLFFETLNYSIEKVEKNKIVISSGVGRQITKRLLTNNKNLYMVKKSLIGHGRHESVMHTEHRKKRPLTAKI